MSIEALMERMVVAVEANTAALVKLEAGREAALAQLSEKADSAPKTTRSRKKAEPEPKAETPAAEKAEPAAAESAPAAASSAPTATDEDLRNAAKDYIGGAGDDAAGKQARAANLKTIADHFGTPALAGDKGIQDPEQRAQAVFFIKRFAAGLEVNFSQDYDFSGDPTQGGSDAAASGGGDDFDIG